MKPVVFGVKKILYNAYRKFDIKQLLKSAKTKKFPFPVDIYLFKINNRNTRTRRRL